MNQYSPAFAPVVNIATARKNYRDIPGRSAHTGQQVAYAPPMYGAGVAQFGANLMAQEALNGIQGSACNVSNQNNAYERVVGLPRICIPSCDCETVETSVCGPFTLTGIYIAPKVAHHLSITRLQVGCNSILVNCDPIPAELFSCCDIDENVITAPTVEANSPICIELENESQREVQFKGALKGLVCVSCQ